MASPADAWNKHRNWCRLVILLHEGGESIVKCILSQMGVDITNGSEIYQKMKLHEKDRLKKVPYYLRKDLLPDSKVVDTTKLDFSARCHIIQVLDTQTKFPEIEKLRDKRNDLFHKSDDEKNMGDQQFNKYWDEISQLLTDFGYDVSKLINLKTVELYHIEGRVEQSFFFSFLNSKTENKSVTNCS